MPDRDTPMTDDEARRVREDPMHAHEALDRAHLAATLFKEHVADHPFVHNDLWNDLRRQEPLSSRLFSPRLIAKQ